MMQMPRRNVTRFFIPLIDVLILLFCIFLLMEFNSGTKVEQQGEEISEKSESLQFLEEERNTLADERNMLTEELQKFKQLNPDAAELARLRDELKQLRDVSKQTVQHAFVRIIDVDGKDGSISFFDHKRPKEPALKITDAKVARALIDRHKAEAGGREVYYYFMYPRVRSIYPLFGQELEYQQWFKTVANSLVKV